MTRKAVLWTAVGAGIAAVAVILFLSSGFRLFAILTPSMGQTAPVGTLVVTHPAESYQAGDIISFERVSRVFTHRIVAVGPEGITTKGDLNGANDPLPTKASSVIGKAVWIAPGLGWVLRGLPWLLLGGVIVWLLSLIGRRDHVRRWVIRLSGWTLVVALVAVWLRPWINIDMLGFTPADAGGGVTMHVVNTGLFPLDANGTRLFSGQDAVVHVTEQNSAGFYTMAPEPALDLWERIALLLVCLIPLAASFLVRPEGSAAAVVRDEDTSRPKRRRLLIGAVVVAVVVSVAAVNQTIAYGSYAAKIENTKNKAGSNSFFTCQRAVSSLGTAGTYFAYALGTARTTSQFETDLAGNGTSRRGRYSTDAAVNPNIACTRDSPTRSVDFSGKCLAVYNATAVPAANAATFSLEAWFRTGTKSNGKIIGFGSLNTTGEGQYDRHIYIDPNGRVVFGVYPGEVKTVSTPDTTYADNQWHHVVATLTPTAGATVGQRLYVDGELVDSAPTVTTAESYAGYWKVGCGNLSGWHNGRSTTVYNGPSYFTGQLQFAAVYTVALTADQVKEHFKAGDF